jgi:Tol biopolymer transport system component
MFNARIGTGKWTVASAVVLIAGCGGGGTSTSTPEEPGSVFAFGNLSGRAAATNPPLTSSSSMVSATALTGTITSLRLQDQAPVADELRLLFALRGGNINGSTDLFSCNVDGTDLIRITDTPTIAELEYSISYDGKRIAMTHAGPGGDSEIYVMNIDGSGKIQVTNNDANERFPRWHPAGNNLVFYNSSNWSIETVNVNTKTVTTLLDDQHTNTDPSFTADGQTIVFASTRSLDWWRLFSMPSIGGPVSNFYGENNNEIQKPRPSPDGLFFGFYESNGDWASIRSITSIGGVERNISLAKELEWSPDSRKIVYTHRSDGGIYVADADGTNAVPVRKEFNGLAFQPVFIPAPKEVQFVGPGSLFGSRLAAMIFTQSGAAVKGLLGVDANTPSTVVLTKQNPDDTIAPNIVFSVDADAVREIVYAHAPYWRPVRVVGGGASVPSAAGALISIDSKTGRIVAVLPFSGVRSNKPTFSDQGNTRVFEGSFLGVFDDEGVNRVRGVVSEVRLDMATGELSTN